MLYSLLEWMNIDYLLNYECTTTIQLLLYRSNKINKHASISEHKAVREIIVGSAILVGNCMHLSTSKE